MSLGVNDKVYFSHEHYTIDKYVELLKKGLRCATNKHFLCLIEKYKSDNNLKGLKALKSVLDDYLKVYMYKNDDSCLYMEFDDEHPEIFEKIKKLYYKVCETKESKTLNELDELLAE